MVSQLPIYTVTSFPRVYVDKRAVLKTTVPDNFGQMYTYSLNYLYIHWEKSR